MERFGIVGGDLRQLYLARSLRKDGHPVALWGLEKGEGSGEFPRLSPEEMGKTCSVVVLPLPVSRDGRFLNAPLSETPVLLDSGFAQALQACLVAGGMVRKLRESSSLWTEANLVDYWDREELAVGNGFLTAEGAIALAVEHSPGALGGSRCLVTGFGRVGKALCLALRGLGAQVDCCARKPRDRQAIRSLGLGACAFGEAPGAYDFVFNTVPAPVLGEAFLSVQRGDTLLMELASPPGGFDRAAAERLKLPILDAPSLPGRFSPKASGEGMKEAVYHMLEERRKQ